MAASERSIRITDAYRRKLFAIYTQAGLITKQAFAHVDQHDLDGTYQPFATRTVAALEVLQRTGIALTAAYVAAYVGSEHGRPAGPPPVLDLSSVGVAEHGAAMSEAIQSPLIGIKGAIKHGKPAAAALDEGGARVVRLVQSAALHAPRQALATEIRTSPLLVGWRRVTSGGCGACLAAASGLTQPDHQPLKVHPHCHCTAEPVVKDASDLVRRPTGFETFSGLPRQRQDELLGPEKAQLVRSGEVPFDRLIQTDRMVEGPDLLTEAPLEALT